MLHPMPSEKDGGSSRPLEYWLAVAFGLGVALFGGASRFDSLGQPAVRAVAVIAMIILALMPPSNRRRDRLVLPFTFLGLVAAALLAQLMPLPPAIWTSLAGHDFYRGASQAAELPLPWRPANLSPERGWGSLFALVVPLATVVILSRLSERRRLTLVLPMLILIMLSGVLGIAQLSGGSASPLRWYAANSDHFATGFFANRNHQAVLLACALPLLAVWATERRESKGINRPLIAAGAGAFLLLMIPTTGSRAGLAMGGLALVGTLAMIGPALIHNLRHMSRRSRRMVLAGWGVAVAGFVLVAWLFGNNDALGRLQQLDVGQDMRAKTLPSVLVMMRSFFPVGSGVGSFAAVYPRFEPTELLSINYRNMVHNDWLQVVVEAGLVGAALLALFVLWWLVRSIAVWRREPTSAVRVGRAASLIILMLLLASVVDYPARTPLMMMLIALAGVWLEQAGRRMSSELLLPRGA